ncbi:unnamed protein product [Urochloa decumbens]|uniref:F-box domain-containing protein n=1 Tax=Urochloa decumbens TaxID=240449 RepID=A0ABC9AKD9_9POAL
MMCAPKPRPNKRRRRRRNTAREREAAMIGRQHAGGDLPDDLVLEILRRVPYRSLCRFKAVSPPWLALCSVAALRRNKPPRYRTLSGFLYHSTRQNHPDLWGYYGRRYGFIDVVKNGRPNPMVDASRWSHSHLADVTLVDCCNGLLLLRGTSADAIVYAVCNPAPPDERLLVLPPPPLPGLEQRASSYDQMRLGFDPAVSPHQFTVFFLHCGSASAACPRRQTAFFNGSLHLTTEENLVLAVDKEGETWRSIRTPCRFNFLGHSEGRLCAVEQPQGHRWNVLAIWFLEDYGGEHWAMKHSVVDAAGLFPACGITTGGSSYTVVAFHPDREMVFLCAGVHRHLMSYDMDSGKSKYICTSIAELYLPYVPCLYQSG